MSSPFISTGNWSIAKGKLKQFAARLVRDDAWFLEGKADELVGRIRKSARGHRCDLQQTKQALVEKNRAN